MICIDEREAEKKDGIEMRDLKLQMNLMAYFR
jgi:hypothetical protein